MSKFNGSTKGSMKTENRSGNVAYRMEDREKLVTAVLTSFIAEEKFYGSTDTLIRGTAERVAESDPEFLAKLAGYARNVFNMRSVSHFLTSIVAEHAKAYTRKVINNVVVRPDDMLEIFACYKNLYGMGNRTKIKNGRDYKITTYPNALKRGMADVLSKFNEFQIAKYSGGSKEFKFRDILNIVHPCPKDDEQQKLFSAIVTDTLKVPYTWETQLSARGNTKEVWNELLSSHKVGYMALLRNLRNILKSGADRDKVLEMLGFLSDSENVRKSKQLPFRFLSAYLASKDFYSQNCDHVEVKFKEVASHLEKALQSSIENLPRIQGRTLIAVDQSGSMDSRISDNSDMTCFQIASLLGMLASSICEDATVVYFDCASEYMSPARKGYEVKRFGKYDSILKTVSDIEAEGGGTDMSLPMKYALEDADYAARPFDRVIYFSDNECNRCEHTIQTFVDKYRRLYNPNLWVYAVDMQGYGTQQFIGQKFNLIAGWSEKVLDFIGLAERGVSSLVEEISKYPLNGGKVADSND